MELHMHTNVYAEYACGCSLSVDFPPYGPVPQKRKFEVNEFSGFCTGKAYRKPWLMCHFLIIIA